MRVVASFAKTRQDFEKEYTDSNDDYDWKWAFKTMNSLTQKIYDGADRTVCIGQICRVTKRDDKFHKLKL